MSMKDPAVDKKKNRFLDRVYSLFGQRLDVLFLGIAGLSLLALCLYMVRIWNTNNPSIRFSPEDIVYGQPLYARHALDTGLSQTNPVTSKSGSNGYPQIQTSENFFDFGEINSSQVVSRTFVIANKGSAPLIIYRAYTTCGCTTADFTASEIPPGKVVLMKLQFDAGYHDVRGYTVRRGVLIETNDPNHPTQEIWIQASVR